MNTQRFVQTVIHRGNTLCYHPARLPKIKEWVDAHDTGSIMIPFSGALEYKLLDMTDEEREAYTKETGIQR